MAATDLRERLGARRPEIEQMILARVWTVEDPTGVGDPEYTQGLRAAVGAALSFGLEAIEGGGRPGPLPQELLTQARRAARAGVSLDTVLRRYLAGHTLLSDFIVQEAAAAHPAGVQHMLRGEAILLDHLVAAISSEYMQELEARARSGRERRTECVRSLLAGELADTSALSYDLANWHLSAIAAGDGAEEVLRGMAESLDRRLLLVPAPGKAVWAWFGGMRKPNPRQVERLVATDLSSDVRLSVGEPGEGPVGWRLSHRQAVAAWPVALRSPGKITRYADVSFLSSVLRDEVLASSLHDLYLVPLCGERDGGEMLRQTLRAYFRSECNSSAASAVLGVTRQTVTNRLRTVEKYIDRPLSICVADLEIALRLDEFERLSPDPDRQPVKAIG